MSRESIGGLAGIVVLAAGVLAVMSVLGDNTPAGQPAPEPTVAMPAPTTSQPDRVEIPLPDMAGVPQAVQRVLYWSGSAEAVTPDELVEVSAEIVRTLIAYQVPLMVPETEPAEVSR